MAFRFFTNALDSGADPMPSQMYRDIQQEYVNLQWDNTTALFTIQEQDDIGSLTYHEIEAWITPTVADTTRGLTDVRDFNKLVFKDIDHRIKRGLMYKFDDNYWIVHSYNHYTGVVQDCGVRRCNNFLRIIDPLTGKLESIPCCVDYDMASPAQQTSRYIITPNNHALVIVQGNDLTLRLLKTNTRYMLSGRPFKLLSYQNAVEYSAKEQQTTLLYLDMYLDEIHDKDDIEKQIADNGDYNYSIKINSNNLSLVHGSIGQLTCDLLLNGEEVEREIVWQSSNSQIVAIDENGNYEVVGTDGDIADISVCLKNNEGVLDFVTIDVKSQLEVTPVVRLEPMFTKIRQYETIPFKLQVEYNGNSYSEFDQLEISCSPNGQLKRYDDGSFALTIVEFGQPIVINANIQNLTPTFEAIKIFEIETVSMMG